MHYSAMKYAELFFKTYFTSAGRVTVVEIGSQDVNGSLRSVAPPNFNYVGLDFVKAKGVDVVLTDPYTLPFESETVDVVITSSCLEHSEFFWLLFNEGLRVLKPSGLFYMNVPSNGSFHRYPVDCWRFYPDSGVALQNWGRRSGYKCALLESFIGKQENDQWNDFIAVFVKDEEKANLYPRRVLELVTTFSNGRPYKSEEIKNFSELTQDQVAHRKLNAIIQSVNRILNTEA